MVLFTLRIFLVINPCKAIPEKRIVIVCASYNNKSWYKKNLNSIFFQKYKNYHLVYIDDCSMDKTGEMVQEYVKALGQQRRVTLIKNSSREGSLANHYKAIHSCDDNAIIVSLDGDDWFAHNNVLNLINEAYTFNDIWMTYGQHIKYPSNALGNGAPIPKDIIETGTFRKMFPFPFSPVRTFYAWLFKKIDKRDLLDDNGKFFAMAGDVAIMFPIVEMAKDHFMFIPDVIYIYNRANPINDCKISREQQHKTSVFIREKRSRYKPLRDASIKF